MAVLAFGYLDTTNSMNNYFLKSFERKNDNDLTVNLTYLKNFNWLGFLPSNIKLPTVSTSLTDNIIFGIF